MGWDCLNTNRKLVKRLEKLKKEMGCFLFLSYKDWKRKKQKWAFDWACVKKMDDMKLRWVLVWILINDFALQNSSGYGRNRGGESTRQAWDESFSMLCCFTCKAGSSSHTIACTSLSFPFPKAAEFSLSSLPHKFWLLCPHSFWETLTFWLLAFFFLLFFITNITNLV